MLHHKSVKDLLVYLLIHFLSAGLLSVSTVNRTSRRILTPQLTSTFIKKLLKLSSQGKVICPHNTSGK